MDVTGRVPADDSDSTIDSGELSADLPQLTKISEKGFEVEVLLVGDSNKNSQATIYLCSKTLNSNCDPLTGSSFQLSWSGAKLVVALSEIQSLFNPEDEIKIKIVIIDPDKVEHLTIDSEVQLLPDPTQSLTITDNWNRRCTRKH